ncbi:uncharacterized protein LOC131957993 [Physella acuta]|uniref:uncharacterized protein LOC131957993 n=1 Tax=Physella acuta TaxID=109671 RepID=UPI0027DCB821|nr:uncharacterized protein LOC131957993 [Physella acuta]
MKKKVYSLHSNDLNENKEIGLTNATCECPRGNHRCSHTAALYMHCRDNMSRTDVPCLWSAKKPLEAQGSFVNDVFQKSENYCPCTRVMNNEDIEWFKEQIAEHGNDTPTFWALSPEHKEEDLKLHVIDNILKENDFKNTTDKVSYCKSQTIVSLDQIKTISQLTVGQSKNDLWHILRKQKKLTSSLVDRIINEKRLAGVQSIMWGINNEMQASNTFEIKTGQSVKQCGLFLHENGILGASPDGPIDNDYIVEIKCPYSKNG